MMGHINNLVVELVRENLGEDGVQNLFQAAGLGSKTYQPELIYPDEEFQALFRGAQQVFGVDAEAAEEAFAKFFVEVSPRLFPAMFELAGSARGLMERIPIIHQNFPAAAAQTSYEDKVFVTESTAERLVLEYDSPNQLCTTLRLVAGHVLDYYGETGDVNETQCQKHGAARCRVVIDFHGKK